jgi:hypothetical protein
MKGLKISILIFNFLWMYCFCANLDGTGGTSIFQTDQYTFSDGDDASGFVCLNGGFSIPQDSAVTFNLVSPVAGSVALNTSGKMTLNGDITLASGVTLSSGGQIDGQGHVIFLDGDITIPAGEVIKIKSNTVIDGQGHVITLEDGTPGGKIIIDGDSGVTLTMRNVRLVGLKKYQDASAAISFGEEADQKLIFNDAHVTLTEDYDFTGGKLEITNTVIWDGNFYFIYKSNFDCTINKNSTLFLDMNTVFAYYPSDKKKTHLKFSDGTSRLFLNGCVIYVPLNYGLQLTKGHLIVDHKTTVWCDGEDKDGYGLILGTGKKTGDLHIDIRPGANLYIEDGIVHYDNSEEGIAQEHDSGDEVIPSVKTRLHRVI